MRHARHTHTLYLITYHPSFVEEETNTITLIVSYRLIAHMVVIYGSASVHCRFRKLVPLAAAQHEAGIQEEGYWAGENITFRAPNIERLGQEGIIFTNVHVATPACTPSRFAALTGRYASRVRIRWQRTDSMIFEETTGLGLCPLCHVH